MIAAVALLLNAAPLGARSWRWWDAYYETCETISGTIEDGWTTEAPTCASVRAEARGRDFRVWLENYESPIAYFAMSISVLVRRGRPSYLGLRTVRAFEFPIPLEANFLSLRSGGARDQDRGHG